MKNLIIEETQFTPRVSFNVNNQQFTISGESCLMHPDDFYEPIVTWLTSYLETNTAPVTFCFQLDYFNMLSAHEFLKIFSLLEEHAKLNPKVRVTWLFQDDSGFLDDGVVFKKSFSTLPFEATKVTC
ncbi:hypothetical protein BKI52_12435 [marine bacterium AO1-C]|nr:hypothetical protein BKI52_12435 [marine bacterium AO1-C]